MCFQLLLRAGSLGIAKAKEDLLKQKHQRKEQL